MNADGSGQARFKVTAPNLLFSKFGGAEKIIADAEAGIAQSKDVTLKRIHAVNSGANTTLEAELSFKDARKLGSTLRAFRDPPDSPEKCQEEILFGDTTVQIVIPKIQYHRELDIQSLVPPESNNPLALRLLDKATMSYRIHLPTTVKNHNADQVSDEGKTLQWDFTIPELLEGPVQMEFSSPIPRLSLYLTIAGLVLFLAIAAGIFLWKRNNLTPPAST